MNDGTPTWPTLTPGETVLLRGRHTRFHKLTIVARILPATPGDGPSLVDVDGMSYRHYDYAAEIPVDERQISASIDALIERRSRQHPGPTR